MAAYSCDPHGGSEAHNGWYTAESVASRGNKVTLATRLEHRGSIESYLDQNPTLTIEPVYIPDSGPGKVVNGELGVYTAYSQWQRNLAKWIRSQEAAWDIAHHVSWGSIDSPCGVLAAKAPVVIGPVGGGQVMDRDHYRWIQGATRWEDLRTTVANASAFNPFARSAAKKCSLILTENQETADKTTKLGAVRVEMLLANCLPNGLLSKSGRPPGSRGREILWVGRFMPRKAANLAAESFAGVVRKVPDARLRFVGDGPTRAAVEQLVQELGLEGSVTFTGKLPHEEVQSAYESAAAMLFSSIRDSSGAQVLEAAAKGCPVIALDQSGVGYWYPDTAGVKIAPTPARDLPERLADAMVQALTMDESEWANMSRAGLEWASRHTWEVRGEELMAIYNEFVGA